MELLLKQDNNNNKFNIIPKLIKYGFEYEYNFIITSAHKISLEQLFISHSRSFSIKKACEIILKTLISLELLHNNNIIHRDINPKVLSLESDGKIKFIHLGYWKYFRNFRKNNKHIAFNIYKKMIGKNIIFGSVNNLIGFELSRRDDLQSLGYMLIYFIKGELPWSDINIKNTEEKIKIILEMKKSIKNDELTQGLPEEIKIFMDYISKMKFEEEPNYSYLKKLILDVINKKDSDKNYYFNLSK